MARPKPAISLLFLFLLVGGILGSTGCSSFTGEEPPLADSTFTRLLTDLHLTTVRGDRFTRKPPALTDSVFAFHGVRREAFDATLRYYSRRPDAFAALYTAVIDTLNAIRSQPRQQSPPDPSDSTRTRRERSRPDAP